MFSRTISQRNFLAVPARSEGSIASTTASAAIPSLTRGNSEASSAASAITDLASALDGMDLLESHDGVLQVPDTYRQSADLLCPFQILDCEESFSDIMLFKTHVFSHFRGQACPRTASCFLCSDTFAQSEQDHGARAWNEMLSHLANDHFRRGQRLATVRTNFDLMRWMYARRMITDAQFKRLQLCPRPAIVPRHGGTRAGEIVNIPDAPMAPGRPRPTMVGSVGYRDEPYTIQAGRRAERRRTVRR